MKKTLVTFFWIIIVFLLGFFTWSEKNVNNLSSEQESFKNKLFSTQTSQLLGEVFGIVDTHYIDSESIDEASIRYGVIEGYLNSLGDKHTSFFTPEDAELFFESLRGDYEGIGAFVDSSDFGIIVNSVIENSPAKKSGVLPGDIIVKAWDNDLVGLKVEEAVTYIKGPKGTPVDLEIFREGELDAITITVIRDHVEVPSVEYEFFEEENIGYISIFSFSENTASDVKNALNELNNRGINGLILDLRNNTGGFLVSSVEILSEFIDEKKPLVNTKQKNDPLGVNYYSIGNTRQDVPMVVLVNQISASASEIVAGALQDYNVAVIVGKTTYGKGSVQQPFPLSDGSEVKVTIAKWFTPNGHQIDEKGIIPDIEVGIDLEAFANDVDNQLETAKKVLQNFINDGILEARKYSLQ